MKTLSKFTVQKSTFLNIAIFLGLFLFTISAQAQKIEVKGVVKAKSDSGLEELMGVNIYLLDKSAITTTNRKGEFTFPKELKIGDVLVFSYLGYLKKQVTIKKNSTNITVILQEDDNEMLGAINTNKRFSSKRKSQ